MSRSTARRKSQQPPAKPTGSQEAQEPQEPTGQAPDPQAPPEAPRRTRKGSPLPSDAEVRERFTRYARHIPVHPLRRSQVPTVLAHLPEFAECAAERAAVFTVEKRSADTRREWHDQTEALRQHHHEAQRAAMLDGTPPPPLLVLLPCPLPDGELDTLQNLHRVIEAKEGALLEDHSSRWEAELSRHAEELAQRIGVVQRDLQALQAEAAPYMAALDQLHGRRHVEDRIIPPTRRGSDDPEAAAEWERIRANGGLPLPAPTSILAGRR